MPCPVCGRAENATTPPCPHCPPHSGNHLPARGENSQRQAVDPEVLAPGESESTHGAQDFFHRFEQQQHQQGGGTFRFASWQSYNGSNGLVGGLSRDSCLPGILTLFLTLTCAVQFGVLAGMGFLIFTLLGSAVTFMGNLRLIMEGRKVYPWLGRALVWTCSWLLCGWLSGGL